MKIAELRFGAQAEHNKPNQKGLVRLSFNAADYEPSNLPNLTQAQLDANLFLKPSLGKGTFIFMSSQKFVQACSFI